jgi:hypothetical protein
MQTRKKAILSAVIALATTTFLVPGVASASVSGAPALVPQLSGSGTDGSVEQVRQIIRCGATMYAVGKFDTVKNGGSPTRLTRHNVFAFSASAPYAVKAFDPNLGGQGQTVACAGDGNILLGGAFSTVGGTAVKNLAKVDAVTGAVLPWSYHPSGQVSHVEVIGGHAIVGGKFPGYLASVDPSSGVSDGYGLPSLSGTYVYPGVAANTTNVYNMAPSPDGTALVIAGVFTSVGGRHHEQLARLNLTPGSATVSAWTPTDLFTHCTTSEPFYAKDAAWSTDGNKIYTATTGYKPIGTSTGSPRSGPCDAVLAYSSTQGNVTPTWTNYSGCDSFYAVTADSGVVYAAGHERWANNPKGCDAAGPGAISAPGLGFFDAGTGGYIPGSPTRGRGLGADDLLRLTSGPGQGLWIASDNAQNTQACAGQSGHMGLCYLPEL